MRISIVVKRNVVRLNVVVIIDVGAINISYC